MIPHHRLTILRNRYRVRELREFRDLVEVYFQEARDTDTLPADWDGAQVARARINRMLPRVMRVVRAAGLDGSSGHHLTTDPGPTLARVDILQRIFTARFTEGAEQEILDVLDLAIGVYDGDRHIALARTVNPFHYLGTLLGFLARTPKRVFAALGFGRRSAPGGLPVDVAHLEAVAARLSNVEELIESRFARLQDRQSKRQADQGRQLEELAERLDFAERILAQPDLLERLSPPKRSDVATPV